MAGFTDASATTSSPAVVSRPRVLRIRAPEVTHRTAADGWDKRARPGTRIHDDSHAPAPAACISSVYFRRRRAGRGTDLGPPAAAGQPAVPIHFPRSADRPAPFASPSGRAPAEWIGADWI